MEFSYFVYFFFWECFLLTRMLLFRMDFSYFMLLLCLLTRMLLLVHVGVCEGDSSTIFGQSNFHLGPCLVRD
jgi:hypothetical protein